MPFKATQFERSAVRNVGSRAFFNYKTRMKKGKNDRKTMLFTLRTYGGGPQATFENCDNVLAANWTSQNAKKDRYGGAILEETYGDQTITIKPQSANSVSVFKRGLVDRSAIHPK